MLKSIFTIVDDGDGIVQAKELNSLNKILCYIDSLVRKTKGDNIAENAELEKFMRLYNRGKINIDKILNKKNNDKKRCWSEGLDRIISKIELPRKVYGENFYEEMQAIAKEQGFELELIYCKHT